MDSAVENKENKCKNSDFQVADFKEPLIAVKRITGKGNHAAFWPGVKENDILKNRTGDNMMLKLSGGGSCVMEVCFVRGGKTIIMVDSGAHGAGGISLG